MRDKRDVSLSALCWNTDDHIQYLSSILENILKSHNRSSWCSLSKPNEQIFLSNNVLKYFSSPSTLSY